MVNDNLEEQITILFNKFVVENDFFDFDEPIDERIDFINGLAMQKFRPTPTEKGLPVIKIRELNQGYCDEKSEYCSPKIERDHTITQGDFVFSWSGSLQAAFWTSEKAGLNQHLFKVVTTTYPKWFVYCWVRYHLAGFQRIAKNKGTTFGHIKRADLRAAKIKKMHPDEISRLNVIFAPLLKTLITNSTELHQLIRLQNILCSKLSR